MTGRMVLNGLALAAAVAMAPAVSAQVSDAELLERGRRLTAWFYAGHVDSLWQVTSASGRRQGSDAAFGQRAAALAVRAGAEVTVLDERVHVRMGRREYIRTARFTASEEPMVLRWIFDDTGSILRMGLAPLSKSPPSS